MAFPLPCLPHLHATNIYCIGRNYADHALELNNPIPKQPVVFSKPTSSLINHQGTIQIPETTTELHHEAELVLAIGKTGKNIPPQQAISYIAGIAAGIDVTDRLLQSQLKNEGLPWLLAKGRDTFAPIGTFHTNMDEVDLTDIDVTIEINGDEKQNGNTKLMLFPVADLIARLSTVFTLQPGDLIYTGTPAGVGPMIDGDHVVCTIKSGKQIWSTVAVTVKKNA
ncbi:MAG: fumarylacetoacetate hydrolase family protein [Bacteroidetes bacterium]|nr:fumarylacetoacetate hydrolase family protein [Bacteroidota bacterium]MCH8523351.1 fumarylacetoacetate hydrolase family protein [Balneolales bacterium]